MTDPLLAAVLEIKELLKLIAEPQLVERHQKQRAALKAIVGKSKVKAKVAFLLDGTRTQSEITQLTKIDKSDLSKLVKSLRQAELLREDDNPALVIDIPPNIFDTAEE